MYGDGSTSRDYTYVDDIMRGILAAINYDRSQFEIINLGNNHGVSLKELISNIEEVTRSKATIDQQPEQPGDVPITFADISKAKQLLDYQPTTLLKDGLNNFYRWFLDNKELLLH
jgi:UDP-glucuronate 4-epimerase